MTALDDENLFRSISQDFADQIEACLESWTIRLIRGRCESAGLAVDEDLSAESAQRCRVTIGPKIRALLSADIDDQDTTPLVILRAGIEFATAALAMMGVPPIQRDAFEERAFPSDVYGLCPASFEDVDESLAEPALVWGAAKAHLHRRRHQM